MSYLAFDKGTNQPDLLTAKEWRKYTTENNLNTTGMKVVSFIYIIDNLRNIPINDK